MTENQKPLSDYISSVEQVEVPVEGVEGEESVVVKQKKSKVFPIVVGVLLFFIIGMCAYYVYNQYFKEKGPSQEQTDLVNTVNPEIDEDQEEEMEWVFSNIGKTQDFSVSKYEFSSSLPLFTMMSSKEAENEEGVVEQIDINWKWEVKQSQDENEYELYTNHLETISYTFLPDVDANCGLGCANEHYIDVDIYQNTGSKSLEEVKEIYITNRESAVDNATEDGGGITWPVEQSIINMWGQQVVKFSDSSGVVDGLNAGYLVVTPKFVYEITYFISEKPAESQLEANNLMNSFRFGE